MLRLEQFDDVFSELMVGLALALIFAVLLAPDMFFDNWKPGEEIKAAKLEVKSINGAQSLPAGNWKFREANTKEIIETGNITVRKKIKQKIELGTFNSETIIFLLLALWIVKYLHENSVLKFYSKKNKKKLELTKAGNILIFVSKLIFLLALYCLIVNLAFKKFSDSTFYVIALFVFSGYMLPDFILAYCRTQGIEKKKYKEKKFLIKWKWVIKNIKVLPRGDPILRALMIWCREDIFNLCYIIAILVTIFASGIAGWGSIDELMRRIFIGVLFINILDWVFNHRFFWNMQTA